MSKQTILARLRNADHRGISYPDAFTVPRADDSTVCETFIASVTAAGGRIIRVRNLAGAAAAIRENYAGERSVFSAVKGIELGTVTVGPETTAKEMDTLDVAILPGELGVAENGGVWVSERVMPHRLLMVICQHIVLVVHRSALVRDLHDAWERIANHDDGYGVLIAGPSKTADIEQALVIGAQGAMTATVVLIEPE